MGRGLFDLESWRLLMAGLRVHTVMPAELVARIDASLTDGVSRGEFVRRAVERALEEEPDSSPGAGPRLSGVERMERDVGAGTMPVSAPGESLGVEGVGKSVGSPAPAEQPEQLVGVEQRPATGVGGGSPGVSKASLPAAAERPFDRVAAFRRATQR